jgi:two-component system cell cycle response regulator
VRRLASSRGSAAALLALTAVFALCAAQDVLHPSAGLGTFLDRWVYDEVVLAAGALCLLRGALRRRDRLAWLLIGLALVAWGAGDVVWTFTVADDPSPPFPSIADIGFLALYPPAYAAIVLLLRSRAGSARVSLWLDGVVGGLAVASVGTAIVFQAVLRATGGSPAAVATNLAYPLADLTLIALVVWALAITGWRPDRTWGLIATGLLVFSISDCLYLYATAVGSYANGGATDVGWIAGAVLLAWAAWQPETRRAGTHAESWTMLLASVTFGLLALGVLVYDHVHRVNALPLVLAGAAVVAVIARMALTFAENLSMIARSQSEARTDDLTGLGNRRKLYDDLEGVLDGSAGEAALVMFDLNGFKQYNDSFGHPAGDALLARLGRRLARYVVGRGAAYRMGGDEFCIVVAHTPGEMALVVGGATQALSERGEGFFVSAASGCVLVPSEADSASEALRLADQRMYVDKQGERASAGQQSAGVLVRALSERHPRLGSHVEDVADLAASLARKLGLSADEIARAELTGGLHDVGKMAIPDDILEKPGPLSPDEWTFLRRHPLVGERILLAAPALAHVAGLVRSSHERFDGSGYPDGLAGTDIPLVSRIVYVCDAFDAMTSKRPFGEARTIEEALAELRRSAGVQFDPMIVTAFCELIADRGAPRVALAS